MSSVLDFPTWLPPGKFKVPFPSPDSLQLVYHHQTLHQLNSAGTKIPGGLVTPVSMQEPPPPPGRPKSEEVEPICLIM